MGLRAWLANDLAPSALIHPRLRRWLLTCAGAHIGKAGIMHGGTYGGSLSGLHIGDGTYINTGVSLHPTGGISIGTNVAMGPGVCIFTGTHDIGPATRRASSTYFRPVVIGDGCWLGARVVVHPGITIGPGCVIASGSIVTADCTPNGLYAGAPAVRKRELEP